MSSKAEFGRNLEIKPIRNSGGIVDPQQEHVTIYRSPRDIVVLGREASLAEPDLFPGWQVRMGDSFN